MPSLQEKLQEVRPKAEELSSSLSKIEEASSSLSRQRSGIRVKKLQRTAGVARDLALKCRMAQARKSLLVRLARQLGGDAFADGKCQAFALAFEVKNHKSVEWKADVCKLIREALQKKMTDIGTCCASWDADCQQLILYFCNCSHTFEATMATRNPDSTSEIESILEQALNKSAESPELKTSFKELHKLHAAEIETPLDLNHLGVQSHGMDGSALNIDWVAPGSWADVFALKMDDVIVLANHCPTAEIVKNHVSLDSENSRLLLFVARGGWEMLRILVGFLTEGYGPDVEDFNELNESIRADTPRPQRSQHAFGTTQKLSVKMTLLVELPRQTHMHL